jgi:hypothetical protein
LRPIAVLGSIGLVAACGGSRPAASTSVPQAAAGPTRSAFIRQADAICGQTNGRVAALREQLDAAVLIDATDDTGANRAKAGGAADNAIAVDEQQLGRLSSLTPPASDRTAVAGFLDDVAKRTLLVERLGMAIDDDAGASATGVLSAQIVKAQSRVAAAARSYGFVVCGHVVT